MIREMKNIEKYRLYFKYTSITKIILASVTAKKQLDGWIYGFSIKQN